jgi:tRNA (guanine37-N1)-methyltransferase
MSFQIDVISIFPEYINAPTRLALLGKAIERRDVRVRTLDPRDHTSDVHRSVDDSPFGGGAGMVMRAQPIFECVEANNVQRPLFVLAASGAPFDQAMAAELAAGPGFSLICGRYEGIDQRVADHLADGEISVGSAVIAGGEAAALMVIEAVTRLIPGVMGNPQSAEEESFSAGLLEYPQYTRPADFRGWQVPEVLTSGSHARIAAWRREQAEARTRQRAIKPASSESSDQTG